MSEVHHLRSVPDEVDKDLVEALERLVEQAKRGEFVACAFAAQCSDGSIGTMLSRANGSNIWTLLGAVQWLQKRLLDQAESA